LDMPNTLSFKAPQKAALPEISSVSIALAAVRQARQFALSCRSSWGKLRGALWCSRNNFGEKPERRDIMIGNHWNYPRRSLI